MADDVSARTRAFLDLFLDNDLHPEEPEPTGPVAGRYVLVQRLGAGAMGIVHRAWDLREKRTIALKRSAPGASAELRERFRREAETLSRLDDPGIVRVLEAGEVDGRPHYAMELVEGESLETHLRSGPLPVGRALEIGRDLARALAVAHRAGLVHRDVKPANILIRPDGRPVLVDFGLVKDLTDRGPEMTGSGAVLGTPWYLAPEQAAGRSRHAGPPTDRFALGVVLHEMLTGRRPFDGDDLAGVLAAILSTDPPPVETALSEAPPGLDAVLRRALARDPAHRFETTDELAAALDHLRRSMPAR